MENIKPDYSYGSLIGFRTGKARVAEIRKSFTPTKYIVQIEIKIEPMNDRLTDIVERIAWFDTAEDGHPVFSEHIFGPAFEYQTLREAREAAKQILKTGQYEPTIIYHEIN